MYTSAMNQRFWLPPAYLFLSGGVALACGNAAPDALFNTAGSGEGGLGGSSGTGGAATGTAGAGTSTGGTVTGTAGTGTVTGTAGTGSSTGGSVSNSTGGSVSSTGGTGPVAWTPPPQSDPSRPDLYDVGACINDGDLAIDCGLGEAANECGKVRNECVSISGFSAIVDEPCVSQCMIDELNRQADMAGGDAPRPPKACTDCYALLITCSADFCARECIINASGDNCQNCVLNECGVGYDKFVDCAGRAANDAQCGVLSGDE